MRTHNYTGYARVSVALSLLYVHRTFLVDASRLAVSTFCVLGCQDAFPVITVNRHVLPADCVYDFSPSHSPLFFYSTNIDSRACL
jgi:hypothetical protein